MFRQRLSSPRVMQLPLYLMLAVRFIFKKKKRILFTNRYMKMIFSFLFVKKLYSQRAQISVLCLIIISTYLSVYIFLKYLLVVEVPLHFMKEKNLLIRLEE